MDEIKNVLCGACYVPLEGIANGESQDRFTCPSCGHSDTRENVLREVGEYAKEMAAQHLEKTMADAARGSKFLKFKPAYRPQRVYRFIVDLDFHPAIKQRLVRHDSGFMKLD